MEPPQIRRRDGRPSHEILPSAGGGQASTIAGRTGAETVSGVSVLDGVGEGRGD